MTCTGSSGLPQWAAVEFPRGGELSAATALPWRSQVSLQCNLNSEFPGFIALALRQERIVLGVSEALQHPAMVLTWTFSLLDPACELFSSTGYPQPVPSQGDCKGTPTLLRKECPEAASFFPL